MMWGVIRKTSLFLGAMSAVFFVDDSSFGQKNPQKNISKESVIKSEMLVKVKACSLQEQINASATVEAKNFAELRSKWTTYIEKINVSEKSLVKKGDLIALTDTKPYAQELDWLERYYRSSEISLKRQEKDLEIAVRRKANMQILVQKGITPASEMESLEQSISGMQSSVQSAKDRLKTFLERITEVKEKIRDASFYAPIDGVVVKLIADPKSLLGRVEAGYDTLVARIEKPGNYIAKPIFLDIQAQKLKEGMKASVILPDGSKYDGKLTYLSPIAVKPEGKNNGEDSYSFGEEVKEEKAKLPSFTGHIEFDRSGDILPSGLLAKVKIFMEATKVKQCVPWNAIRNQDGRNYVDTYREDVGWEKKDIILGKRSEHEVEVLGELGGDVFVSARLN